MTISKRLLGAVSGLVLGAIITGILAYIAMSLFYEGGGFVIDFGPAIILLNGIVWGGISGAIVGALMRSPLKSFWAGLFSALGAMALLYLVGVVEDGFIEASTALIKSLFSSVGVLCFVLITTFSAFVIGAFNQEVINSKKPETQTETEN